MNRLIMVLVAFALVVAACSGANAEENAGSVTVNETAASSSASSSTAGGSSTDSTAPTASEGESSSSSTEAKAVPEGSPAKDFTLALEPSGEFVLSQEVKPVYMVFWAEW